MGEILNDKPTYHTIVLWEKILNNKPSYHTIVLRDIPVKSPVFNRSLLFFGLHFTCLLFFSCFFLVSCFSPVFLENQSKATIFSCFSSSSAQIYSYSLACNSALLACLNNNQLTLLNPACPKVAISLDRDYHT